MAVVKDYKDCFFMSQLDGNFYFREKLKRTACEYDEILYDKRREGFNVFALSDGFI